MTDLIPRDAAIAAVREYIDDTGSELEKWDIDQILHAIPAIDPAAIREALFSLPAVYDHQINTGVREVYDPLQRFYTMESVLAAITEATK